MKNSLALAAFLCLAPMFGLAPLSVAPALAQDAAKMETKVFSIENMTCALCPVTVKNAMEKVAGVKSVTVDFDAKTATVIFDPSIATIEDIADASTFAGYPAHVNG